jgi:hypothetical protein
MVMSSSRIVLSSSGLSPFIVTARRSDASQRVRIISSIIFEGSSVVATMESPATFGRCATRFRSVRVLIRIIWFCLKPS